MFTTKLFLNIWQKGYFLSKNDGTIKYIYSSKSLYWYECMTNGCQWKFVIQQSFCIKNNFFCNNNYILYTNVPIKNIFGLTQ